MDSFVLVPVMEIVGEMTENKAVYTATSVADGWAAAENLRSRLCYQRADGPTDRKVACRVASPRQKIVIAGPRV